MNLHRMKPKSQSVAIIFLNHLIFVRFTESKVLFVTASVSHLDQTQQTSFFQTMGNSFYYFMLLHKSLYHKHLLIRTFTQQNNRTKQVVCGKKKKSMNNVTIYAIELSNSNFFQPSRLTRCSTHPITCRPRIEWLHNFKQIAHQTRYKK